MSEELEKSYSHWHVDDYEFEKRIHMFNEETHSALMPDHADAIYIEYHKEMYEMIREISRQAYRTFDYRLMRDWIFGRPWKQIHVILDSDEQLGIYEVAEHAKEIIEEGGWLSRRLFSVLPKDLHTLSETQCPVCIEAWENGDIVTE